MCLYFSSALIFHNWTLQRSVCTQQRAYNGLTSWLQIEIYDKDKKSLHVHSASTPGVEGREQRTRLLSIVGRSGGAIVSIMSWLRLISALWSSLFVSEWDLDCSTQQEFRCSLSFCFFNLRCCRRRLFFTYSNNNISFEPHQHHSTQLPSASSTAWNKTQSNQISFLLYWLLTFRDICFHFKWKGKLMIQKAKKKASNSFLRFPNACSHSMPTSCSTGMCVNFITSNFFAMRVREIMWEQGRE